MKRGPGAIEAAERARGGGVVWGTEFENVHASWRFYNPNIVFRGSTFRGSEQIYQLYKVGDPSIREYEREKKHFVAPHSDVHAYNNGWNLDLRSDWEEGASDRAIKIALSSKFADPSWGRLF